MNLFVGREIWRRDWSGTLDGGLVATSRTPYPERPLIRH
jgi:hypothetical protein